MTGRVLIGLINRPARSKPRGSPQGNQRVRRSLRDGAPKKKRIKWCDPDNPKASPMTFREQCEQVTSLKRRVEVTRGQLNGALRAMDYGAALAHRIELDALQGEVRSLAHRYGHRILRRSFEVG
jgi:hypothetical protein